MPADLSPVSTLCLAILHRGEATGYEIKKECVEGDYRYFIDASYGAIYPALARLAAEGFATHREETQPGRPARKVYAITPKGRDALLTALSEPPEPDVFRSRFLLVAKFASELPQEVVARALAERRRQLAEELEHIAKFVEGEGDSPAANWLAAYGRACLSASLDHIDTNGDALVALADRPVAHAAE
ncbi:MAG: PadR family transcriptional regulator [Pseudomonadota bacterium]